MKTPTFPFQQGGLDYLCHVYAAVNLLHLRGKIKSVEQAGEKFKEAMKWILEEGNLFKSSTEGMDPGDVEEMLNLLGIPVEVIKAPAPLVIGDRAANGAVIFIEGDDWDHYTVIRTARGTEIVELFDSYGYRAIQPRRGKWLVDGDEIKVTHLFAPVE